MKRAQFVKMIVAITAVLMLSAAAWGSTYRVIYNFTGGQDGAFPVDAGNLAIDPNGNLYGTTQYGGDCLLGTLFELSPNGSGGWTETVLHSFCGSGTIVNGEPDGAAPSTAPIYNSVVSNPTLLTGTTTFGGSFGEGTGFVWTGPPFQNPPHDLSYSFQCSSGCFPYGNSVNLSAPSPLPTFYYDVFYAGGASGRGAAIVDLVAYSFCSLPSCVDGADPAAGVAIDDSGDGYGTTNLGGASNQGVVYECVPQLDFSTSPNATITGLTCSVLHSFAGGTNDGAYPLLAPPILTRTCSPNLCNQTMWGTTPFGGAGAAHGGLGYGTVFDITTFFGFQLAHSFNLFDGAYPYAGLTNLNGTFYGTTSAAGFAGPLRLGRGTIYSLTPSGTLTTLHVFTGPDGAVPYSGLVADSSGNLYGVTNQGGAYGYGVVYEITP
jgi:uncharacterized repeat protein (TIGR03803 family)